MKQIKVDNIIVFLSCFFFFIWACLLGTVAQNANMVFIAFHKSWKKRTFQIPGFLSYINVMLKVFS